MMPNIRQYAKNDRRDVPLTRSVAKDFCYGLQTFLLLWNAQLS